MREEWRSVVGFEGFYEVSSLGRVRSLPRYVNHSRSGKVLRKGVERKQGYNTNGYRMVGLSENGRTRYATVHRLVAEAFLPPNEGQRVIRHLNDDREDNRAENLAWGSDSENMYDAVRNGVHPETKKTHCKRGHEFSEENTYLYGRSRKCRTCKRGFFRKIRQEGIPEGDPRHGTKTAYTSYGCKCPICTESKIREKKGLK